MKLSEARKRELDQKCLEFRRDVVSVLHDVQTGHPGGSLSVCEILTAIYLEKANIDPRRPDLPGRDKVVLCKGHAAPMLYRILAELGYFPLSDLKTLRQIGSHLQGHPCPLHTPGVEAATGPLGAGYPAALGMALANRLDGNGAYVYAVLGDGELDEGVVWETCLNAAKQKADGLITIVDHNGVQLDGTNDEILPLGDLKAKFQAFGYSVLEADGHDVSALCGAIDRAKENQSSPTVILARTVKGKGVSFTEGKNIWHGRPISDADYETARKELGGE